MSSSLETLKQELLLQKDIITKKGGSVYVANQNPSPSEITAGINSIEMPDLTVTTATINDVRMGKTFYSGDFSMKTGVMPQPFTEEVVQALFSYESTATLTDTLYYTFHPTSTTVRTYMFYKNPHTAIITLADNTTSIESYAFYGAKNFTITNINDVPLTTLGQHSLHGMTGIDLENMWPTLTKAGSHCLDGTIYDNTCINLPALETVETYSFYSKDRKILTHIDFSKVKAANIELYSFANLIVNSDVTFSEHIQTLSAYCFYGGSFKTVTIPTNMKTVQDASFGGSGSHPSDIFQIKEFTFLAETPPSIGATFLYTEHLNNGCKIYVPDTAVETYKALPKLVNYVDYIFPMSQKP